MLPFTITRPDGIPKRPKKVKITVQISNTFKSISCWEHELQENFQCGVLNLSNANSTVAEQRANDQRRLYYIARIHETFQKFQAGVLTEFIGDEYWQYESQSSLIP